MKTTDFGPHHSLNPYIPGKTPRIMIAPVISTEHIQREDDLLLYNADYPMMARLEPGYLLRVSEDFAVDFEGYSDAFLHLLETFQHLGFEYLRLDPDGDVLDDLPRFKW